jgi:hypothetical protein
MPSPDDHGTDAHIDPDKEPTHEAVESRASGRPPEEESSEDPEHQAEVILEESEERTFEGAEKSVPT